MAQMVPGCSNYDMKRSKERLIKSLRWNEAMKLVATLSSEEPSFKLTSDNIFLSFVER